MYDVIRCESIVLKKSKIIRNIDCDSIFIFFPELLDEGILQSSCHMYLEFFIFLWIIICVGQNKTNYCNNNYYWMTAVTKGQPAPGKFSLKTSILVLCFIKGCLDSCCVYLYVYFQITYKVIIFYLQLQYHKFLPSITHLIKIIKVIALLLHTFLSWHLQAFFHFK